MKTLIVFLGLIVCIHSLSCNFNKDANHEYSTICSDYCMKEGYLDGQCEWSYVKKDRVCYCEDNNETFTDTETGWTFPEIMLPSYREKQIVPIVNSKKILPKDSLFIGNKNRPHFKGFYVINNWTNPSGSQCKTVMHEKNMELPECYKICMKHFPNLISLLTGQMGGTLDSCICNYC